MRLEEAETLAKWILELKLARGTVCLNIGSSTGDYREVDQPHIQRHFIEPVEAAGIRFVHSDIKQSAGVDEIGNIRDSRFHARLKDHRAELFICSNVLEHLTQPKAFARACANLVRPGGYGLLSVPSYYPYHPDPIDTMLRLSPEELAALLPTWTVVRASEIDAGSYWQDLRKSGNPWRKIAHQAARVALPFYRPTHWRANLSRLSWLFRPYRVSVVLLRKPEPAAR